MKQQHQARAGTRTTHVFRATSALGRYLRTQPICMPWQLAVYPSPSTVSSNESSFRKLDSVPTRPEEGAAAGMPTFFIRPSAPKRARISLVGPDHSSDQVAGEHCKTLMHVTGRLDKIACV